MKFAVAAMSGGVDSTVAAALMREAGYQVHGVTLRLKDALTAGPCGGDPGSEARIAANAAQLGVTHEFIDCAEDFRREILAYCWDEYRSGRTPNPCARCNRRIKFGLLADYARKLGAEVLVTGHYAEVSVRPGGALEVTAGADPDKNQVYFLSLVDRKHLAFARMPLARWRKDEVRAKARDLGVAERVERESQDACFTFPGDSFPVSLGRYFHAETPPGDIVDTAGRVIGRHRGLHRYTIGQRKGLEVALGKPAYVTALDLARNQVVLSTDPGDLLCRSLRLKEVNLLADCPPEWRGRAQFRYRQKPLAATIAGDEIVFDTPVSRPAAGQVAAFFDGPRLIGGGIIAEVRS